MRVRDFSPAKIARQAALFARSLVLFACIAPHPARAEASSGFNFCAPPHRPECVFADSATADACEREVNSYVATVFRYRQCLEAESERAVRESNDVIDHWRCRQRGERCRR